MPTVFRLDSSIRTEGSVTRAVASTLEAALVAELGDPAIIHREIGLSPVPSTAWAGSIFGRFVPEDERTPEQQEGIGIAAELADELEQSDAFIFATPFYNFGVSQHVKTWVDVVISDPRFAPGSRTIAGRPAYLVIARGGGYGPGTPRHGWDHGTDWLVRIFSDVWGLDLEVIEAELTLAESTPAMAELRDLASQKLEEAHAAAAEHGRQLAGRLNDEQAA